MISDWQCRVVTLGVLLVAALPLSGCSTSIGDMPVAGASADAEHPKDPGGYLPVHDIPPNRDEAVISVEERTKIQADLIRARDHQAAATAPATSATPSPSPMPSAKGTSAAKQTKRAKPPSDSAKPATDSAKSPIDSRAED